MCLYICVYMSSKGDTQRAVYFKFFIPRNHLEFLVIFKMYIGKTMGELQLCNFLFLANVNFSPEIIFFFAEFE